MDENIRKWLSGADKWHVLLGSADFETMFASAVSAALASIGSRNPDKENILKGIGGITEIPAPDLEHLPPAEKLKPAADQLMSFIKNGARDVIPIAVLITQWVTDPASSESVKGICGKYGLPEIDPNALSAVILSLMKSKKELDGARAKVSEIISGLSKQDIISGYTPKYLDEAKTLLDEFTYKYKEIEHKGTFGIAGNQLILYIDGSEAAKISNAEDNAAMISDVKRALCIPTKAKKIEGGVENALELCHYMNAYMKTADESKIKESSPMASVPPDLKDQVAKLAKQIMSGDGWTVMNQRGEGGDLTISGEGNDTVIISAQEGDDAFPTIKCVVNGHGYTWKNPKKLPISQATPAQWAMFAIVSYAKTRTLVGDTKSDDLPQGITNSPDAAMFSPQMWLIAGKDEYKQINMKSDAIKAITSEQKTPADTRLAKEWYRRIRRGFETINFGNALLNGFRKMPIKILKSIFNKDERIRVSRCPLYTTGETEGNRLKVENYTGGKAAVGTAYLNTYYKCVKAKNGKGWVFNPMSSGGKATEQVYESTRKNGDITLIISRIGEERLTVQLIPDSDAEVLFTDQYGEL